MTDICGNCKFINLRTQFVNGSYLCSWHHMTVEKDQRGCYLIQKNKVK